MGAMDSDENSDFGRSRAEEDVRGMGLGNTMSWADLVDKANSVNSASIYFPEMHGIHCKSSRRYASLIELQDKAITAKEKNVDIVRLREARGRARRWQFWRSMVRPLPIRILLLSRFLLGLPEK
ncbi:hypothetical protein V6N13_123641 [Hibiscus sabdariffa]|uniref:Uncharacterized protein n=1 Tax=Hibiscus sabdariffa TaxID=183260 RepID=A0ABR2QU18_9ROSI